MLYSRSRTLILDIAWSLGASIAVVSLMATVQGSLPFPGDNNNAFAPVEQTQEQQENAAQRPPQPQFDKDGTLVDNLSFASDASADELTGEPADTSPVTQTANEKPDPPADSTTAAATPEAVKPPRTTTTAPTQATTTAPAPAPQTPESSAERPPADSSPPPPPPEPSRQERIEVIADQLPFNWRAAGVTLTAECAPNRSYCHWGLYTVADNTVWVGTEAFSTNTRLFYVVAHELAHAWQFRNDPYARMEDLAAWDHTGVDGLEAAADCLAKVWGATANHYWECPSDARSHMTQVFTAS